MKHFKRDNNIIPSINNTQTLNILLLSNARTIRRLRKIRNFSQGRAALISGISQSYLSNAEHAKHMFSIPKYYSFYTALGFHFTDCFNVFNRELYYCQSLYNAFKEDREEFSCFQELVKYDLENFN